MGWGEEKAVISKSDVNLALSGGWSMPGEGLIRLTKEEKPQRKEPGEQGNGRAYGDGSKEKIHPK